MSAVAAAFLPCDPLVRFMLCARKLTWKAPACAFHSIQDIKCSCALSPFCKTRTPGTALVLYLLGNARALDGACLRHGRVMPFDLQAESSS